MATSPKSALATLRPDLGMAMMEFDLQANMDAMVALQVCPILEVDRQAGNYGVVAIEELLKTRTDTRPVGGRYNQGEGSGPEPGTYACQEHGMEEPVDDREAAMYADYFDSEILAAQRARHVVLQNLELDMIALAQAVSYTDTAAVNWSTNASADPVADMTKWRQEFFLQIGSFPNLFVMSRLKFEKLCNTAAIIDRLKYAGFDDVRPDMISEAMMAGVLKTPILIAGAAQNTANEGAAKAAGTATLSSLWPDRYGLLLKRNTSQDTRIPSWARTIHWAEDGSQAGAAIESYRDESRRSNMVRCRMDRHIKQLYPQAALYVDLGTL